MLYAERIQNGLTDACEHAGKESCAHCEEGCAMCGVLEQGLSDDGHCEDCEQSRAESAADAIYESMKYGE